MGAIAAIAICSLLGGPIGVRPVYAADPEPSSEAAPVTQSEPSELKPAAQRVENVIAAARQYLGVPYRVGSEGPLLFDCSGLVFRAFSDASLVDRVSGMRLRAAGYMRWFARQGLMTANEEEAQRGDLVIYDGGKHIGIYLGDGRTISALLTGVTVHSLHGISQAVTGFLRPDWSGKGDVPPFEPLELPEVVEEPAVLVPGADWITIDQEALEPIERESTERADLRTPTTRTFENRDGTFTTEFHAQPIHYLSPRTEALEPIDLRFVANERTGALAVTKSPVQLTARPAAAGKGLVSAVSTDRAVSLRLPKGTNSDSVPVAAVDGRAVDYFDVLSRGVGLRVLGTADGFRSFLVLARDPERNRFTFALDAPGLTAALDEIGDVLLLDEAGTTVGRIPRPMLLDSSDSDGYGGGLDPAAAAFELTVDDTQTLLTIVVKPRFLDEAAYPAYLDLSLTGFPASAPAADLALISSRHPDFALSGFARPEAAGASDLWLGRQPRSKIDTQALLRFNELAATLGTVDVASASLELLPYLQRDTEVAALVSRADGDWSADAVTWNTRPEASRQVGTIAGESGQWLALDVSGYASDVLSRGATDDGLLLHGEDGATGTWKRIIVGDLGPRLVVTWSGLRPTALADAQPGAELPGQAATEDAAVAERILAWTLPSIASAQERFEIQLSRDGFATTDFETGAVRGTAGRVSVWTLPVDALTESGDYEWRVRVRLDGSGWSEWSAPQAFSLDLGPVATESVTVPLGLLPL